MAEHPNTILPKRVQDIRGRVCGLLTVVDFIEVDDKRQSLWLCKCECGRTKVLSKGSLGHGAGSARSCGCLKRRPRKYNVNIQDFVSEYRSWWSMIARCYDSSHISFDRYGGRQITVCSRWKDGEAGTAAFDCFIEDMGAKPSPSHSLDRVNNDGNYEPSNCRWSNAAEQASNRKSSHFVTINQVTRTISEWSRISGLSISCISKRLHAGCPPQHVLAPSQRQKANKRPAQ